MAETEFSELAGYLPVVRPGGEQIQHSTTSSGYAVPRASQPQTDEVLAGETTEPPTADNIAYGINATKQAEGELQTTSRKSTSVLLPLAALVVITLILAVVGVAMAAVNKSNSNKLEALQLMVNELQRSLSGSLAGLELYSSCSTAVEASCTVPLNGSSSPGFSACEAGPIDINSSVS